MLLVAFSTIAAAGAETRSKLRPLKGSVTAGDFILKDLGDNTVRFSDFRDQVVLLNFWATWCLPCRKEMPAMERLYQAYRADGFAVVAVSLDQSPPGRVKAFVEELKLSFPVLHDRDGLVSRLYSVPGVPTSYLISPQGKIAYRMLGEYDWFGPEARSAVEELLQAGYGQD